LVFSLGFKETTAKRHEGVVSLKPSEAFHRQGSISAFFETQPSDPSIKDSFILGFKERYTSRKRDGKKMDRYSDNKAANALSNLF